MSPDRSESDTSGSDALEPVRRAAVAAGEALARIARAHVDLVAAGEDDTPKAEDTDRALWEAVAAYGDALDDLYGDDDVEEPDDDEPDEITFTVRTRYDYTVVDEKAFLSGGSGLSGAIESLLKRAGGRPVPALEIAALETGSGLITAHLNREPLTAGDFTEADEPTDLLLVDPGESLQFVLDEPVYESRAEAEAAARRHAED